MNIPTSNELTTRLADAADAMPDLSSDVRDLLRAAAGRIRSYEVSRAGDGRAMRTEIVEDRDYPGQWLVEQFDNESGACYVTVFSGPDAEARARTYHGNLEAGALELR